MTEANAPRKPRFYVGDVVRAVGASVANRAGQTGTLVEVLLSAGNVIYRYRVMFPDGELETFFGFELELVHGAGSKSKAKDIA
jgi:hypothetical protein